MMSEECRCEIRSVASQSVLVELLAQIVGWYMQHYELPTGWKVQQGHRLASEKLLTLEGECSLNPTRYGVNLIQIYHSPGKKKVCYSF